MVDWWHRKKESMIERLRQKVGIRADLLTCKNTALPKGHYLCYTIGMTAYEKIYEQAADNYGYITTREASELGVPKSEMSALAKRNRLVRKGYGVYRLATHYLPTEYDGYAEAVLLGGDGAIVWGESVLAMHDLALVNPPVIEIATDRRVRRTLPPWIRLVRRSGGAVDHYQGIPCQPLADAIRACRGSVMDERLADGVRKAEQNGELRLGEAERLLREMGQWAK